MSEALRRIRRELGGGKIVDVSSDQLRRALSAFAASGVSSSFTDLKYVSFGVTVPFDERGSRVIDKRVLFDVLLRLVEQREIEPSRFRRCYQGLLHGYFSYDRRSGSAAPGLDNWVHLRAFLHERLAPTHSAAQRRGFVPDWLQTLHVHANLLTANPCVRYAKSLIDRRTDELRQLFDGLGIPSDSWVWEEVLMAYVVAVCEMDEAPFKQALRDVLRVVNGETDFRLPHLLAVRATATVVKRYSSCADRVEDERLRDTCVSLIGNPWMDPTAWQSRVNHEPARTMVEGWLKRRLIKDFFELLAKDGAADLRRLNYWLKWEPQISDMWFVLGEDARRNRSTQFLELRKRMAGRDRILIDGDNANNAFIMRIGPLLVIEFGVTGNACYVFAASDFRKSLDASRFTIYELKQRVDETRMSHNGNWGPGFDQKLAQLLRAVPASKGKLQTNEASPAVPPVLQTSCDSVTSAPSDELRMISLMCIQKGIEWEDNRAKNGALWVLLTDRGRFPDLTRRLENAGFVFKPGHGFSLK